MTQRKSIASISGCVLLGCLAGCTSEVLLGFLYPDGLPAESVRAPRVRLVGGDDQRLCYLQFDSNGADSALLGRADLFVADLDSAGAQRVAQDLLVLAPDTGGSDVACDGQHAVWPDRLHGGLVALDLTTGETRPLATDYDFADWSIEPRVRSGRVAVAHRRARATGDVEFSILWIDIATGTTRVVDNTWGYGDFDIDGDILALHLDARKPINLLSLELGADLDIVDFNTLERHTIAARRRVGGGGGEVFVRNGEVLWHEFAEGGFSNRIRAYTLATGDTRRVFNDVTADNAKRDDKEVSLRDVGAEGVLLETFEGEMLFGGLDVHLIYAGFDGVRQEVLNYAITTRDSKSLWHDAQLNGTHVVWLDVAGKQIVLRDLATGAEQVVPAEF